MLLLGCFRHNSAQWFCKQWFGRHSVKNLPQFRSFTCKSICVSSLNSLGKLNAFFIYVNCVSKLTLTVSSVIDRTILYQA